MLDKNHRLCQLSEVIDWVSLEQKITELMSHQHQAQWRLVTGSIYLKSFCDLSTADVIKKWSTCAYLRFFCTGEVTMEPTCDFPFSSEVLDQLSLELEGQGYDAMIKALRDYRLIDAGGAKPSPTLH